MDLNRIAGANEVITVTRYASKWLADRRALGLASAGDDEARLKRHALPVIGEFNLEEVRPRHICDDVLELRKRNTLAPRTILHVYATLATMFRTAVSDELIAATPCVLPRGILPKKVDKGSRVPRERHFHGRGDRAPHERLPDPRRPTGALRRQGPRGASAW
jgi:hypothetical protein